MRSVTGDGRAAEHPRRKSKMHPNLANSQTGHVSEEKRASKTKNEGMLSRTSVRMNKRERERGSHHSSIDQH